MIGRLLTVLRCWCNRHGDTYRETSDGKRVLICPDCQRVVHESPVVSVLPMAHERYRARPSQPATVTKFEKRKAR